MISDLGCSVESCLKHRSQGRRRKQLVQHLNPLRRVENCSVEDLELQDLENGISSIEHCISGSESLSSSNPLDTESIGSKDREARETGPC